MLIQKNVKAIATRLLIKFYETLDCEEDSSGYREYYLGFRRKMS